MKSRIIWGAVLLAAFAAFYFVTIRPMMTPAATIFHGQTGDRTPLVGTAQPTFNLPESIRTATIPTPVFPTAPIVNVRVEPPALKMEIPIQNGATIDFSFGAPVVRSGGADDRALEQALQEMADATKNVEFPPTKP